MTGTVCSRVAELRKTERSQLLEMLTGYPLSFNGHEGYAKVLGLFTQLTC